MLEPRFRWTVPAPAEVPPSVHEAGIAHGLGAHAIQLIVGRGVADSQALDAFFAPPVIGLHDAHLLPDADRFVDRIERARSRGERVLVFGDFDADGLTGLAVMTRALRRLGVDVTPYVPGRVTEGHGLSEAGIEAARAAGAELIITVDCGSSSAAEAAVARTQGLDVIVTDHHRVPETAPEAVAFVNPHRPDATYPDRRLTGAGLAYRLAGLLFAGAGLHDDRAELAALATVGTVADVAPVLGENRSIARLGIEGIRGGGSAGIAAILRRAGIDAAAADLETVGFAIAPRLNAAGRVGESDDAAALLLTDDPAEADRLAERLEAANLERRDLTKTAVAEARAAVAEALVAGTPGGSDAATVIRGDWPAGIVGLVAARLAEEHGRPAVVGANMGDVIRASCRGGGGGAAGGGNGSSAGSAQGSAGGLDLTAALRACDDLLIRYGGHRGAAGFEIEAGRWDSFRERFLELAAAAAPADPSIALGLDLTLPADAVGYDLLRDIARLAPFGPGHPDPILAISGLTATRVRAASGGHTQLTLKKTRDVLDGIAFGRADLAGTISQGDRLDVVARLMSRRFGGFESLQLDVRDAAPEGHLARLIAAARGSGPAVAVGPGANLVEAGR